VVAAQVKLAKAVAVEQLAGRASARHAAALYDVCVLGVLQRDGCVLLGDQEADPAGAIQLSYDFEDFLEDLRRSAHRGLVQQDQAGLSHQGAPDRDHLLLAPEV
jgi:hypothetical protein